MFKPLVGHGAVCTRIDRVITSATVAMVGTTHEVMTNVWLVGNDDQVLVIDAAHDAERIQGMIGGREVSAIACTHAHPNHINAARTLSAAVGAPVLLHPDDFELWHLTYPDRAPDGELVHGGLVRVANLNIRVLATPGHTPGSVCLYAPALDTVFAGDTLLASGHHSSCGAGPSSVDLPADLARLASSVQDYLLRLPAQTRVLPGHGPGTTVRAAERRLGDWMPARGQCLASTSPSIQPSPGTIA